MSTPPSFFHLAAVDALLARAARCSGTPLSVHYVERHQEGNVIASWGSCAACRYVSEQPQGRQACRLSRTAAASMALRQRRPLPFVCHMGFACVSAPALPEQGFVLTFGPYCPSEESRGLAFAALQGLEALTDAAWSEADEFPVDLEEIHRAPGAAVPAVAEWTVEALAALCEAEGEAETPTVHAAQGVAGPERGGDRRKKPGPAHSQQPCPAADIAAALAGGNQPQARDLFRGALEEAQRRPRPRIGVRRAHTFASVAAVLEAAERAGLDCGAAWAALPEWLGGLRAAQDKAELLDAAMDLLGIVRRRAVRRGAPKTGYAELNAILREHLGEAITLEEVARQLGENPSAISHRLQRKFGMSYSDYVGRLRVDKAKELLRRTKLSVTAVAHRVGIGDPSNFGKTFKKFAGMSPGAYRKTYGSKS